MAKPSNREKILTEGLKVVHARGFAGASVRDIVEAAGVPQGSFTNHFQSKEAFGLEIIDRYLAQSRETMRATLLNEELKPLTRLAAFFDSSRSRIGEGEFCNGCLLGNFAAEASTHSEAIRNRLNEIFAEIEGDIAMCLKAAVRAGELPKKFDCDEAAAFIFASLQGATLMAKAERSSASFDRLKDMVFSKVLR